MGIRSSDSIKFEESTDRKGCVVGSVDDHPCSVAATRVAWGLGGAPASGRDVQIAGETEDTAVPGFSGKDNGLLRVQLEDGTYGLWSPAPPNCRIVSSSTGTASGDAAAGDTGDVILIEGLVAKVKADGCPVRVRGRLEVCDWLMLPTVRGSVAGWGSWEAVSTDESGTSTTLVTDRKDLTYGDGGSFNPNIEYFEIAAGDCVHVNATLGLNYLSKIDDTFTNRIGSARIVLEVCDVPDLNYTPESEAC